MESKKSSHLKRLLSIVKRTGQPCFITDADSEEIFVLSRFEDEEDVQVVEQDVQYEWVHEASSDLPDRPIAVEVPIVQEPAVEIEDVPVFEPEPEPVFEEEVIPGPVEEIPHDPIFAKMEKDLNLIASAEEPSTAPKNEPKPQAESAQEGREEDFFL